MKNTRRIIVLLLVLVGIAALVAGCSLGTVSVSLDDAGAIKVAHLGDRLVVRLAGNPSTGYTWGRTAPSDAGLAASPLDVARESEWEFPAGENMPGASGLCIFEYIVARTGTVTLEYAYARSWETEPVQTFSITIWAQE